eukprot:m.9099 g.9099  ORF g.9099 m.9099 type:complete len:53 (+) comp4136_c0_seq2:1140-1298(+)
MTKEAGSGREESGRGHLIHIQIKLSCFGDFGDTSCGEGHVTSRPTIAVGVII